MRPRAGLLFAALLALAAGCGFVWNFGRAHLLRTIVGATVIGDRAAVRFYGFRKMSDHEPANALYMVCASPQIGRAHAQQPVRLRFIQRGARSEILDDRQAMFASPDAPQFCVDAPDRVDYFGRLFIGSSRVAGIETLDAQAPADSPRWRRPRYRGYQNGFAIAVISTGS